MTQRVGQLESCLEVDEKESVRVNDAGTAWEAFAPMDRTVYDFNNDGIVDKARMVSITARNTTGSTITKGSIVYVSGASGNHVLITLADKDSESTSSKTLGMVVEDIAHDANGIVAVNGTVDDLNTNAYAAGTGLYLGDNGGWTSTLPTQPAHSVFIGWVTIQSSTGGRVVLHIQNGYELQELHNVLISSPADKEVLTYESSSSLWKNKALPGSLTPLAQYYTDVNGVDSDNQDAYSYTLPANTLAANGDSLHAIYAGSVNGTTITSVSVDFAGTTIFTSDEITAVKEWQITVDIIRTSSTTARCTIAWLYGSNTSNNNYIAVSSGLDFTTSEVLKLVLFAEDTGSHITAKMGKVWKIAAA